MTNGDWLLFAAIVIALVTLLIGFLAWRAAVDALGPLKSTVAELKESAKLQTKSIDAIANLSVIQELSREAAALSDIATYLALIPSLPNRLHFTSVDKVSPREAMDGLYRQDRAHLLVALAKLPSLDLPLTKATARAQNFPDALNAAIDAAPEAKEQLDKIIRELEIASSQAKQEVAQ